MSPLRLICVACGNICDPREHDTCPHCGPDEGILDVEFDLRQAGGLPGKLAARPHNIWRYAELLPVDTPPQSLADIGWTPLIEAPRLAAELGVARVRLKDDGRNASGSFKDRASAVGVARALQQGFREIACASTGNAATSLARCAASAGLSATIFVASSVPQGKLAQLLVYGARVFCVEGTYADAYRLCTEACQRFRWYNRNCAVNPYLVEGKKTAGLEIAEQCASDPPGWVVLSVGDGCSIAGVAKGLREMHTLGLLERLPRMLGVQARDVAPLAAAADSGTLDRGGRGSTYADSINVPIPRNWRKAVAGVRHSRGAWVTVGDDQIRQAAFDCGRLSGVFAEPAAAAAVAGAAAARRDGVLGADDDVLIVITGNGLKDIAGALSALPEPHRVPPDIAAVERIVTGANP